MAPAVEARQREAKTVDTLAPDASETPGTPARPAHTRGESPPLGRTRFRGGKGEMPVVTTGYT